MSDLPVVAGTLQTDPRSGGLKRSSGVNVLPEVPETWRKVRDDSNPKVDWLIAGYVEGSTKDITVLKSGNGGIDQCSQELPVNQAVFGGFRHQGRFMTFFYADEGTPTMQKGRASMHKNGVLNVLEGADGEIEMQPGITEVDLPIGGNARKTAGQFLPRRKFSTVPSPADSNQIASSPKRPPDQFPSDEFAIKAMLESIREPETISIVPYVQLCNVPTSQLPQGVDPSSRELSLSKEEFEEVFGMTRSEFQKLATWKRNDLKKQNGLF